MENKRTPEITVLSDSPKVGIGVRYKPCVCTVVCLGLIYSYASSGIREPSTTFASALPCAKHVHHVSEACTWLLCSSDLDLQNEISPDRRRAKGVCFNTLIKTFLFVTQLSGWHCGLALFIHSVIFIPMFSLLNSF